MRTFSSDLSSAHGDATATLKSLGAGYSGAAYEALTQLWGSKFTTHVGDVVECCGVLATALDAGADFIVAQKMFCIGELVAMAAEFVADQAASVATLGIAEAALPVIEEATDKLMEYAEQQLEQYMIGQIANAALKPLMSKIDSMMENLVFGEESKAAAAIGSGVEMDHGHILEHAARMEEHGETIRGHAAKFTSNVRGLDFAS
ncbi:MAG: hypothetical protein FWE35_21360 [Streptosporangiales bacterium]|nr:hypothetical protein [Streptosporangiales bacterium]